MDEFSQIKLEGRYFPSGSSASKLAILWQNGDQLLVVCTEDADQFPVTFLELADRLGNLPRKIYFEDASTFECADNDAVDFVFGKDKHFFSRLSRLELSWKFAAFACLATFAVVLSFYRYGLPVAAQFAAWATPSGVVQLIDKSALDTVDRIMFEPSEMSDADKQKYQEIFAELVSASSLEADAVRLLFRDGGRMGANAVALPGGTVILTDQLAELAESDDEVAGVLAHEIGHVAGRHSLRQIYRALGIAFMAAIVIGDTSQLLDNVIAQVALLDTLSFSRKFETESDKISTQIMLKLQRDPVAFVDLLDRVFKDAGVDANDTNWLSTHPGNETRRENVLKEIDRIGG